MTPLDPRDLLGVLAAEVATVASDALAAAGRPVGRTGIVAGQAAWDDCCAGQVFAAIPRRYRTLTFPLEDVTYRGGCGNEGSWAAEVVVGVVRCVPTFDSRGEPPSTDDVSGSAASLYQDAETVWWALIDWACRAPTEVIVASQSFIGAEGGCIAVETRLLVADPAG